MTVRCNPLFPSPSGVPFSGLSPLFPLSFATKSGEKAREEHQAQVRRIFSPLPLFFFLLNSRHFSDCASLPSFFSGPRIIEGKFLSPPFFLQNTHPKLFKEGDITLYKSDFLFLFSLSSLHLWQERVPSDKE